MKMMRTGIDSGWRYQLFVKPVTLRQKVALYFRGYRPIKNCMLAHMGWWVHPDHKQYLPPSIY